jgi:hypothetical protein
MCRLRVWLISDPHCQNGAPFPDSDTIQTSKEKTHLGIKAHGTSFHGKIVGQPPVDGVGVVGVDNGDAASVKSFSIWGGIRRLIRRT